LLNELRVAGSGIQVLLAFLLVVPFNARFGKITAFERDTYYVTLVCVATAAVLLIAPSIQHRIVFRQAKKEFVVRVGSRLAIIGMGFLAVGMTGIFVLISHFLFGAAMAIVAGVIAAVLIVSVWFVVPLRHRQR
jgi:Family of unknown function (DUF6328)